MSTTQPVSGLPPSLIVSARDMARLEAMLDSPVLSRHPAAIALMDELNRAEVVPPEQVPADVVTMHSQVECEDEASGEKHVLTLVYPNEADVEKGRVSVLAPVGTALLGLSVGQSIDWQAPGGRPLRLRVTAVRYQPEAAGDLHR
ncbi:nucleoside diphosphate kinase regulator [Pseudoxanthomonas sp. SGNA-20]|jgi:Transcription elongation factor|uniref:nucleoside diphosphate kinase regulator n=1 Tax=unclassified Pseudoxanthomonas TaxID=2645906 RepID=UPI0002F8CD14|nr:MULTISPECIES: nucleoside diphosphate kinase regulator [unclassified Pseudoxanthomonas]RRN56430.1 nucleoside diphosphate kinase regulator [Pseudoxanthomonas sp. SGNA-20]RRN79780.1 nucleoside diphosphate kinase regulator [Pseudoxanthomonas sp. SGD-10]